MEDKSNQTPICFEKKRAAGRDKGGERCERAQSAQRELETSRKDQARIRHSIPVHRTRLTQFARRYAVAKQRGEEPSGGRSGGWAVNGGDPEIFLVFENTSTLLLPSLHCAWCLCLGYLGCNQFDLVQVLTLHTKREKNRCKCRDMYRPRLMKCWTYQHGMCPSI